MANPNTAHEPSMEEILASIRQIISEDGDGAALPDEPIAPTVRAATPPAEPEPAVTDPSPSMNADEDTPALAAEISAHRAPQLEAAAAAEPAPRPQARPQEQPMRAEPQYAAPHYSEAPRPHREFVPQSAAAPAQVSAEPAKSGPLLSAGSGAAVSGAFSALAHTILAQNARTLEDLVSEMLRPMLQGWLDDNLPALVERLVKEEIDRVSRGRR